MPRSLHHRLRGTRQFKVTYIDTLTLLAAQASPFAYGNLVIPRPGLVVAIYLGVTTASGATRSFNAITIGGASYDVSQIQPNMSTSTAIAIGAKVMAAGTYAFAATAGNSLGSFCAVWLIEGYKVANFYDFAFNQTNSGTSLAGTYDYPGGGVVLSGQLHYNTGAGTFNGPGATVPEGPFSDASKSGSIAQILTAADSPGEIDTWSWAGSIWGAAAFVSIK